MSFPRRRFLAITPAAVAAAGMMSHATFGATTDLAVTCDAAAAPAVRSAGTAYREKTGVRVRVFPTAPGLVLPRR